MSNLKASVPVWLNDFDIGETRYIEVKDQEEANNLVRQISAKSRRHIRTRDWRIICTAMLAMNVSNVHDQQMLLQVTALGPLNTKFRL